LAVPNSNVNELTAITNDFFMPDLPDLVFDQSVFFQMLRKNERTASGGAKINQPILYQFSQDGAYFPGEKGDTSGEDQITRAEFNWKFYRQRVVIDEEDIDMNSGPEQVFDLLDAKVKGAGTAIRDKINTDLFTAANNDATRAVNSLENLLGDGTIPTSNTTAGGINKATASNAFWRGETVTSVATIGTVAEMNELWFDILDGNVRPNLIISNPDALDSHHDEIQGTGSTARGIERLTNTDQLKTGFVSYFFNGAAWQTDRACPTTKLFMLNMDFMHIVVHSKRNFELKPFQMPEDQFTMIAWIKWMGGITSSDPSRSGYMTT
jgi:hypothetical protein